MQTRTIQVNAKKHDAQECAKSHYCGMAHWTNDYVMAVLDKMDWSMNRLAEEAGLSASTINRPIKAGEALSPKTVSKVFAVSKVDPAPFMPQEMDEPPALYTAPLGPRPQTNADRVLRGLGEEPADVALRTNEIKIALVGPVVQIVATVDRAGLAQLQTKLEKIADLLDE